MMKSAMTETVPSWGRGRTAAVMAPNEQTTEEHSTLEQQSPGRLDHPAWCVVWRVDLFTDDYHWQVGTGICGSDICGLHPGRLKSEATLWPLHRWRCQSPSDILGDDEQQLSTHYKNNTHIHNRLTALCPGLPRWAGTRKVKQIWISLKQETVSGSGISWAICKSAHRSRQITTPAPHHSVFTGRMPFLPPKQQR